MKKFFLASLLLTSAGFAQAGSTNLVNADGSELSAICIAAVTSREALYDTAAKLRVVPFEASTLRCNGMTLTRFLSTYRDTSIAETTGYVFNKSDNSPVTELCLAAVKSEQDYLQVKEQYFSNDARVESEVLCNGMPLLTFARKYRAEGLALSSR